MSALENLINAICTSRKGSIGSINNVYLPQLNVKYVEEAAAELAELRVARDEAMKVIETFAIPFRGPVQSNDELSHLCHNLDWSDSVRAAAACLEKYGKDKTT